MDNSRPAFALLIFFGVLILYCSIAVFSGTIFNAIRAKMNGSPNLDDEWEIIFGIFWPLALLPCLAYLIAWSISKKISGS